MRNVFLYKNSILKIATSEMPLGRCPEGFYLNTPCVMDDPQCGSQVIPNVEMPLINISPESAEVTFTINHKYQEICRRYLPAVEQKKSAFVKATL